MVSHICLLVELGPICNSMAASLCLKSCEDHSLLKGYNGGLWKNIYRSGPYSINVLQQTACLVVNPITVGNFAFLLNCTPVGVRLAGLQTLWRFWLKDLSIDEIVGAWCFVCCQHHQGLPVWFLLLRYSVLFTVESLSLLYLLFYILIYMF